MTFQRRYPCCKLKLVVPSTTQVDTLSKIVEEEEAQEDKIEHVQAPASAVSQPKLDSTSACKPKKTAKS